MPDYFDVKDYVEEMKPNIKPLNFSCDFSDEDWEFYLESMNEIGDANRVILNDVDEIFEAKKPPLEKCKPPFETIYFEFESPFNGLIGMLVSDVIVEDNNENFGDINFQITPFRYDESIQFRFPFLVLIYLEKDEVRIKSRNITSEESKKSLISISELACKIIGFVNSDNVELKSKGAGPKRNEIRKRTGKKELPPPYYTCKVKVPERKYSNEKTRGEGYECSYRFKVRGHFRFLKSDYFTNKQGELIWIPPHIRGPENAPFIPKTYEFEKRGEGSSDE